MGKSQSRLGFKSRFENFWGVIRRFKDSIQQPTIAIPFGIFCDSIWAMRFDSQIIAGCYSLVLFRV